MILLGLVLPVSGQHVMVGGLVFWVVVAADHIGGAIDVVAADPGAALHMAVDLVPGTDDAAQNGELTHVGASTRPPGIPVA